RRSLLPTGPRGAPPPAPALGAPASALRNASPLPISKTCFACGVDNPLGLRVQLEIDDQNVRGRWTPSPLLLAADGEVATVAVTTLLDEAAFWLGAAASGESGMTTDLRVVLHGSLAVAGDIIVSGSRV